MSRSRTVNPLHSHLVLSGVSIRASSNLGILGVKFDKMLIFEDQMRIVLLYVVSLSELVL